MKDSQVFRVNTPQVVSETIDGEVVIINLDNGVYYSLLKTGAEVWNKIERQLDFHSLVQEMAQTYDGSVEEIAEAINEFLKNLRQEELIVEVSLDDVTIKDSSTPETSKMDKPSFEKPILEKFTDMEDLLLLDPIHEVDVAAGWPNAKTV